MTHAESILRKLVDPLGLGAYGPRRRRDGSGSIEVDAWIKLTEEEAAWLEAKVAEWNGDRDWDPPED